MRVYKFTQVAHGSGIPRYQTWNGMEWGNDITREVAPLEKDAKLCTNNWIHAYEDPFIASLMLPYHLDASYSVLWEAEAEGTIKRDGPLKLGATRMTTIRTISTPRLTDENRLHIAFQCALFPIDMPSIFVRLIQDCLRKVLDFPSIVWEAPFCAGRCRPNGPEQAHLINTMMFGLHYFARFMINSSSYGRTALAASLASVVDAAQRYVASTTRMPAPPDNTSLGGPCPSSGVEAMPSYKTIPGELPLRSIIDTIIRGRNS